MFQDDEEEYEAEYEDGEEDEDFVAGDIEDIPSNGGGDEYDFDDDSDLDDESLLSGGTPGVVNGLCHHKQRPKDLLLSLLVSFVSGRSPFSSCSHTFLVVYSG